MRHKIVPLLLILLCSNIIYAGNFDRRIAALMFTGNDNSLVFEMRLYYDAKGNLVKVKQFNHLMKFIGYEEYFYDSENRKIRENIFDSQRVQQKYTLIEYAEGIRIATVYNMDGRVIMTIETEYDKSGRVKRIVEYTAGKESVSVSKYHYYDSRRIRCTRDLPVDGHDYYYIIQLGRNGMLDRVDYFRKNGTRAGYVRIVPEDGIMTSHSLNDIIF
ncbi:MAG TPA: hypothetical protein PK986_02475 [Spirochaetota bacterium]|nr:hypothetical protein [Spirochaetota bacterium]HQO39311.1 hypothetical protein [Spirochaetota bacterium]